ncbi:hypothetical protein PSCICP_33380 [Pseudomonas cichorii]|uniref:Uncharacterized protein n=1 Tax=Pseudomonas cichorii TaxID=36746 RepID=A0ABQ1DQR3_PSECI|nr:hypothetical protein PSCICP_33380 [Pseudomonas cichorii]
MGVCKVNVPVKGGMSCLDVAQWERIYPRDVIEGEHLLRVGGPLANKFAPTECLSFMPRMSGRT